MKRPLKFTIICNKTGSVEMTNREPFIRDLQSWEATDNQEIKELRTTKSVWIDVRYTARIRLWKYIEYTSKGKEFPRYKPTNILLP